MSVRGVRSQYCCYTPYQAQTVRVLQDDAIARDIFLAQAIGNRTILGQPLEFKTAFKVAMEKLKLGDPVNPETHHPANDNFQSLGNGSRITSARALTKARRWKPGPL